MRTGRAASAWLDVSVELRDGMPVWPGNPPVSIKRAQSLRRGGHSNVSTLSLGSHTGTHIDAPAHFLTDGDGVDRMPYEATNGAARVLEIRGRSPISREALERLGVRRGERLLFKTRNSVRCWKSARFVKDFVYLSTEAGRFLADRGARAVGVDYLSVGGYHRNGADVHHVLLEAGIWIIEGLDLSGVRPGRYELACLPLRIAGGDGAPARAFLRAR